MDKVIITGHDGIFAVRLRKLMEEPKTTQQELASNVGVTRQAISQYMDGSVQPNIEKFYKIVDYFKVSADYLLGKTNVKTLDTDIQAISDKTGLSEEAIGNIKVTANTPERKDILNQFLKSAQFNKLILDIEYAGKDYILAQEEKNTMENAAVQILPNAVVDGYEIKLWIANKTASELISYVIRCYTSKK
ncbi:helix-turn-helix domain-containing protein [Acetobacterium tundrae]|uniref:Helix-turn-helix domain-containing protein n=1 Tax=Acetobacterium tundrae TaxID=132932 RepID=A0ABR6WL59_9FIRM|nr:helix-turn-helix domain-containing protein [Acetobacterium tundrae]MBC3797167.1 helix-turn-helix domain-containing protein [Acetobacterium tundrae]